MRVVLTLAAVLLCTGCPRYRDGVLGAHAPHDGGSPDGGADAQAIDDDEEHEGFFDVDDGP